MKLTRRCVIRQAAALTAVPVASPLAAVLAPGGLTHPAAAQAPGEAPGWRHALSLFGDIHYPPGFAHFAYVNPQAGEKPKEKWPKTEPADGEAYDPKVLAVEIRDAKYRDYSVKAFAPPTRTKK